MKETTRRDFLKGTAAVFGVAGLAHAQQDDKKKKDEDEKKKPDEDDLFASPPETEKEEEEETRACPQCGALMYRQGNTWTCDTCGYSYVE